MRFLANPEEIDETIVSLIRKCKSIRWAVAWASHERPAFEELQSHANAIRQLTVGTHFYQTHPDFIRSFQHCSRVRFIHWKSRPVFHPKFYLFEHRGGQWDCVLGSPNFTRQGFSTNREVAVLIGSRDLYAAKTKRKIDNTLDQFFDYGAHFDDARLLQYRGLWSRRPAAMPSDPDALTAEPPPQRFDVQGWKQAAARGRWECKSWLFLYYCIHVDASREKLKHFAATLHSCNPNLLNPAGTTVPSWWGTWENGFGVPRNAGDVMGFQHIGDTDEEGKDENKRRIAAIREFARTLAGDQLVL